MTNVFYPFLFLFHWTKGLMIAAFSDWVVFTFVVTGMSIGLAMSSFWAGFAGFFVLYSVFRIIDNLASAVIVIAQAIVGPKLPPPPPR